MAVISNLTALTILASEQQAVQASGATGVGYGDITGMLTDWIAQLNEIKTQLTNFNAAMPSGSNKTAIATVITNLA
jgi:hypothetical protein